MRSVFSALAAARSRLKLQSFDRLYITLRQCRVNFSEALTLLKPTGRDPPEQKRVLQYSMDFMLAQAHRIVSWRCSEEQLDRAREACSGGELGNEDNFEVYKSNLQALRMQSAEEAFQAARRVMKTIGVRIRFPFLSMDRLSHV